MVIWSVNSKPNYFQGWSHFKQKLTTLMILNFWDDRQVWTNSVDPDQTAPEVAVWSGSTLFAIPSESFGHVTL